MSLHKKALFFNRRGMRWFVSFVFTLASYFKTKTFNRFIYNSELKRWTQFNGGDCYYIDIEPNWSINLKYLVDRTTQFCLLQYKPTAKDVIIDIGAGIGTETYYFAKIAKVSHVYAIEAHPETSFSLKSLISFAKLKNVTISNIALSSKTEEVFIESGENHSANRISRDGKDGTLVKAMTLDEYIEKHKISKIDLIKMNIEGSENEVIKGMEQTLKATKYIAISCHDFLFEKGTSNIKNTIIEILSDNGFELSFNNTGHPAIDSWVYGKRNISILNSEN
ncbi:MAG: FkbM family methyltransferase [Salinivirgaceae bacterium]|nr:FkbM family methyltransferase [Salinivirgaceae bacterium]